MVTVLRMAYRNLLKRKLRLGLTAAGIAVGVALVFSLLTLTATAEQAALQSFRRLTGYDIAVVNGTFRSPGFFQRQAQVSQALIYEDIASYILSIEGVYAATPVLSLRGSLDGLSVTLQGIDPSTYPEAVGGVNVVEGYVFTCLDCSEAVVGRAVAEVLNLSVGSRLTLSIGNQSGEAVVVGIFETGMRQQEMSVYLPLRLLQNLAGLQGYVTQILVKCLEPRYVESVANAIRSSFPGLTTVSLVAVLSRVEEAINTVTTFFLAIGMVALTAGGFGVMNTMFMSVVERTREIGILKSIGATDTYVFTVFLIESALIGLVGGVVGLATGLLLIQVVPSLVALGGARFVPGLGVAGRIPGQTPRMSYSLVVSPEVAALSLAIGVAVSVVAGFLPAYRVARIRPAEAVRYV